MTRAYLRFSDRIMLAKCEVARRFPRSDKPSEPISRELERLATGDIIWKHRMPSLHRLASAGLVVFVNGIWFTTDKGRAMVDDLLVLSGAVIGKRNV